MRRCIYHTDLGQNVVFHNFSRKIAFCQYSGRSIVGFYRNRSKISKNIFSASRFSLLISAKFAVRVLRVFEWTLIELRFNTIKNLLCLLFLLNSFITMCNLKKRLIRAAFWALLQAMFMNDWKQTAQRLKLQERLLTIYKRNIIRWNIYRNNNFHSRGQVLSCLKKSWVF